MPYRMDTKNSQLWAQQPCSLLPILPGWHQPQGCLAVPYLALVSLLHHSFTLWTCWLHVAHLLFDLGHCAVLSTGALLASSAEQPFVGRIYPLSAGCFNIPGHAH